MKFKSIIGAACLLGATLTISTGANAVPTQFAGNGHYYEVFLSPSISWGSANAAAQGLSFMGETGHLATITSAGEDLFLDNLRKTFTSLELWVGGFQMLPSTEPGNGWAWVNGEGPIPTPQAPVPGYSNWLGGEPNNVGATGEHWLAIGLFNQFGWNDEGATPSLIGGYVVEYDIPEPGTLALFGLGLVGLGIARRRKAV